MKRRPFTLSFTFVLATMLGSCSTLTAQKTEAEAAYLSQQLDCVDQNSSKVAIDECRARVKAAWSDAGVDAGKDGDR